MVEPSDASLLVQGAGGGKPTKRESGYFKIQLSVGYGRRLHGCKAQVNLEETWKMDNTVLLLVFVSSTA
eukprot:5173431-Pyramimonas_sp.AAC.1